MDASSNEWSMWNMAAQTYDRVMRVIAPGYRDIAVRARRAVAGSERVLEVACGTGLITLEIAADVGRLDALDASPQMIAELRSKVEARAVPNVNPVLGSAYELPWGDSTFDAVVCASALHVLEKPELALSEMVRVLRPGGMLVAPTFLHREGLRAVLISTVLNLFGSFRRLDHDGLRRLIEEAGFQIEELDVVSGPLPMAFLVARTPVVRSVAQTDMAAELARESATTQPVPLEEAGSEVGADAEPLERIEAQGESQEATAGEPGSAADVTEDEASAAEPTSPVEVDGVPVPRELVPPTEPEALAATEAEALPAAEPEELPAAEALAATEPEEEEVAARPVPRRPRRGAKPVSRVSAVAPTLRPVEFRYRPTGEPKRVLLTGSFSAWSGKPPRAAEMSYDAEAGAFCVTVELPPGRHTYKYVVDGQWMADPANPNAESDGLGGINSVREVE